MSEIKIFELTQKILEESEAYILNHSSQTKAGYWFSRQIIFPIKFLFKGSEEFLKPFTKWGLMSFAFLIAATYIVDNGEFSTEIKSFIFSVCLYAPMVLVMFSVPSTYAYYGVEPKDVDAVVEYLEKFNIQDLETIDCLQSNLENIHTRIINRVSAYKWIIGASWALFSLILNQQLNVTLKINPDSWKTTFQENIIHLAVLISISILAIWITTSYKRASELLIKTLEFGLVEIKHKLHIAKSHNRVARGV